MRKEQRYRYEMFVRVRDFGTANRDRFPESSTGGQTFAEVAAAVAEIEDHLTQRDLARVEARRVKAATRAVVFEYMKTLAHTARRATKDEPVPSPFVLPARRTVEALLSKARLFAEEASAREANFVALGLPPTFISEFTTLVDQLHVAAEVKNSGRAMRAKAQTGIEHALVQGFEAIKNLDVLVPNVLRGDPVRVGHWRGARRLEGLGSSSRTVKTTMPATVVPPAVIAPPAPSPAAPEPTTTAVVPVQVFDDVLRRAS